MATNEASRLTEASLCYLSAFAYDATSAVPVYLILYEIGIAIGFQAL